MEEKLFPPHSIADNWYRLLANEIGISKSGKPKENDLKIFTYNYDRSLEHYLTKVIENRIGVSYSEAVTIRNKIEIYHLHGALGSSNPNESTFRPYNSSVTAETIKSCISNIKIISQQSDRYDCHEILKDSLDKCEVLYFFGFGYHPVNMRRLMNSGLRDALNRNIKVTALRYKIKDHIWSDMIQNQFEGLLNGRQLNTSVTEFIENMGF